MCRFVREGSPVSETIGPDYLKVVNDLKAKIGSGELPIGAPIPSTKKLMEMYSVSSTVARRAVRELQNEGIVRGHTGKAVYVEAKPGEAVDVEKLRDEFASVTDELGSLKDRVGALEAQLADLYARTAHAYQPNNGTTGEQPKRRKSS